MFDRILLCTFLVAVGAVQPAHAALSRADINAIEQRLDTLMRDEMAARHIPGAVVVVVDRERILLAQGYGLADLERGAPVDPARTTFRIASVSKLFTATAVMQLVERGTIDLDQDVNTYLTRFQAPSAFGRPVTLRHLLTHTAGFGLRFLGSGARTREAQRPLGDYLARRLPSRFIEPGEIFSYSNNGIALAGFVVESVVRRPFHDYVAGEILGPLRMRTSGFDMEDRLLKSLATGYVHSGGRYRRIPVAFRHPVPSGSFITTGEDMARFMRAHLNGGCIESGCILAHETVAEMHRRQYSHSPHMIGVGYGFFEHVLNGRRYVGHDGDVKGFSARMLLAPQHGLGLFLAHTGTDATKRFGDLVTTTLFDPILPVVPAELLPARALPRPRLERLVGTYRWTRYARRTMEKLFSPYVFFQMRVEVDESSGIRVASALFPVLPSLHLRPVGGGLFQSQDGRFASFRENEAGEITHLFLDWMAIPLAFERISWVRTAGVQLSILSFFLVVFPCLSLALAGAFAFRRRRDLRWPLVLALGASLANALFLLLFPGAFGLGMYAIDVLPDLPLLVDPGRPAFFHGPPPTALVLLALPLLALGLVASLGVFVLRPRRRHRWTPMARTALGLFVVLHVAFALFLNEWNLLGYHL